MEQIKQVLNERVNYQFDQLILLILWMKKHHKVIMHYEQLSLRVL